MATTKLTDAQRVILAAAATRESGLLLPLPRSLGDNRGTLGVILKSLLTRGLVTERPILPDEDLWRDTAELGRTTLVISASGLQAIGIEPTDHSVDAGSDGNTVTDGGEHSPEAPSSSAVPETTTTAAASGVVASSLPKEGTKLGALIAALRRPQGAAIAELMQATGWQAHSVRGAISGNLKKKLKLEVVSEVLEGRGRVYRIPAGEASA